MEVKKVDASRRYKEDAERFYEMLLERFHRYGSEIRWKEG